MNTELALTPMAPEHSWRFRPERERTKWAVPEQLGIGGLGTVGLLIWAWMFASGLWRVVRSWTIAVSSLPVRVAMQSVRAIWFERSRSQRFAMINVLLLGILSVALRPVPVMLETEAKRFMPAQAPRRQEATRVGQPKESDIQKVNASISGAQQYFARAWTDIFHSAGQRFPVPNLVMYQDPPRTACGNLGKGNAYFCPADNTIYLDSDLMVALKNGAAGTLHTDGDYAAIVAAAHELGHAVSSQLNAHLPRVIAGRDDLIEEHAADCYAGVITRRAKTDHLLEAGDLEEGLLGLSQVGDKVEWVYDVANGLGTTPSMHRPKPNAHGTAGERQQAFLQGYYGGANFCSGRSSIEMPPATGRLITAKSLLPSDAPGAGTGRTCKWSGEAGGLRIQTLPAIGDQCTYNLLGSGAQLPDHVRIDLTVRQLPNSTTKRRSSAGLYYGDGRPGAGLTGYAFGTDQWANPILALVTNKSRTRFDTISDGGPKFGNMNENRFTIDVHHEGAEAYFLAYMNGYFVGFHHTHSGVRSGRLGVADQAGVWLGEGFDEALVKDFRISALPD